MGRLGIKYTRWTTTSDSFSAVARLFLCWIRNQGIRAHSFDKIVKSWAIKIKIIWWPVPSKALSYFLFWIISMLRFEGEIISSRYGEVVFHWSMAEPERLGLPGKSWSALWKNKYNIKPILIIWWLALRKKSGICFPQQQNFEVPFNSRRSTILPPPPLLYCWWYLELVNSQLRLLHF